MRIADTQVLVGHTDDVTCVSVSVTNKSLVVSGSKDANLICWDINTGNDVHTLSGHLGCVTCVRVSGDGSLAVSGRCRAGGGAGRGGRRRRLVVSS